jgi:hypothetical protein
LNYAIPIVFIVFFGYLLDRICKPADSDEKNRR